MKPILTREEIAERWQCTLPTVDARVKSGVLKPCRKLPPGRFRYEDVLAAEGVDFDPMQPSERLRLEKENEALRNENKMLSDMLNSIAGKIMPYMMKKQVKVGE